MSPEYNDNLSLQNAAFFDEAEIDGQGGPDVAKEEVDFILRHIELPQGARVLDVPCGEGHHAQVLAAEHGFEVTGIDGGSTLIDRAKTRYSAPTFKHAYFNDLSSEAVVPNESQDAVMCINQSFGYLPTLKENEDLLVNMYYKLKPGGFIIIQTSFNPLKPERYKFQDLAPGETNKPGDFISFSPEDGPHVDSQLPSEYGLRDEDENFRDLEITNSARVKPDGSYGPRKKYANYLALKHDWNPDLAKRQPLDMPVLRTLAMHAGIDDNDIIFRAEPYNEGQRTMYHCLMLIKKPTVDQSVVNVIVEGERAAIQKL